MDKYIGRLLDNRYQINELIGSGGMANVYNATDNRLLRNVALKILKDEFASDDEFKKRFKNESNAVARLSHKNIVNVYDISTSYDVEYIVMELIEGITLKEYLQKKGRIDWKQVLFFAYQIAEALDHAHSRGIIHQDIKPHNIMLLRDGTLKVADFGIAKLENENETKVIKEAIGSVHYISPEQAKGSTIDSRTDIYSLGVVMYEMITGTTPFKGETAISIVMQHINALPAPPSSLVEEGIPQAIEYVIEKAMCPSLKNRYAQAKDILTDLEKIKANPTIELTSNNECKEFSDTIAVDIKSAKLENSSKIEVKPDTAPLEKLKPQPLEDYDDEEEEHHGSRVGVLFAVFVVLIIVIVSGIFAFNEVFSGEIDETIAPNLLSSTYEEVLDNEVLSKYNIEITEEIYDSSPAGTIIEQMPLVNSPMLSSDVIYITVSLGPKVVTVPDVIGFDSTQTRIEFSRASISYEEILEYDDEIEEGKVIKTEPAVNTEISEGTEVLVYVSAGPEVKLIKVPNLHGLSVLEASDILTENGLELGQITPETSLTEPGLIIFQDISANTETVSGTKVNVVIAEKPVEPGDSSVIKNITINIPENLEKDIVLVEVFLGNELVYGSSHGTQNTSFDIEVRGAGTGIVSVYVDGELTSDFTVSFE